jgi:Uma2 family endonuclease
MKTKDSMKVEEPIMDYNQLDHSGTYSYMDYLRWHFKERVELIRGKIVKMAPAPNVRHQTLSLNLTKQLLFKFDNQPCKIFVAPFDVRLPIASLKNGEENTVVQPDLCIICDEKLLDEQGYRGAPDLVVEILSPGNSKHEMQTKFDLYEESGVKEYWIVESEMRVIFIYTLKGGKYIGLRPFTENMEIESSLFADLKIPVSEIFYGVK